MQNEETDEWETRPIYDIVKIDLFKKWAYPQITLSSFRQERTPQKYKNFQNSLMLLYDALRPHLIKRYKTLPESLSWLDKVDTNTKLYMDRGRWITAYKTLSNELMEMGILNVHDTKDDENAEYSTK